MAEISKFMNGLVEEIKVAPKLFHQFELLQAEAKKLKEFARYIIERECWSIYDQDGGDIQDLAEKLGLIEPHIAIEEDVDDSPDYIELGDTIYRFTEALEGK